MTITRSYPLLKKANIQCRVLAKSLEPNTDLWEIVVHGRRGWVPKNMISEQKILLKSHELHKIRTEQREEIATPFPDSNNGNMEQNVRKSMGQDLDKISPKNPFFEKRKIEDGNKVCTAEKLKNTTAEEIDFHIKNSSNKTKQVNSLGDTILNNYEAEIVENESYVKNGLLKTKGLYENIGMKEDEINIQRVETQMHRKTESNPKLDTVIEQFKSANNVEVSNDVELDVAYSDDLKSTTKMPIFALEKTKIKDKLPTINEYSSNIVNTANNRLEFFRGIIRSIPEPTSKASFESESIELRKVEIENIYRMPPSQTLNCKSEETASCDNILAEESTLTDYAQNIKPFVTSETDQASQTSQGDINIGSKEFVIPKEAYIWYNEIFGTMKHIFDQICKILNFDSGSIEKNFVEDQQFGSVLIESNENSIGNPNIFIGSPDMRGNRNDFFSDKLAIKIVAMIDVITVLLIVSAIILIFLFGRLFFINNRKQNVLILKLNNLERKYFLREKEFFITKTQLVDIQGRLDITSNKSFGVNDKIQQCEIEKKELQDQISALEKELEAATEAGLELNKMVLDLLNNQNGSDSIIHSVEELQCQLNEQEATTIHINNLLAEKSRENSELKVLLQDTKTKFLSEINELNQIIDKIGNEKTKTEEEMRMTIKSLELQMNNKLEIQISEANNLKMINLSLKKELDDIMSKWQSSAAQAKVFEDALKAIDMSHEERLAILDATDSKANFLMAKNEVQNLEESLKYETDRNTRLQGKIKTMNEKISSLQEELNQIEKYKLEAETRLNVLSNYFKERELQLQK